MGTGFSGIFGIVITLAAICIIIVIASCVSSGEATNRMSEENDRLSSLGLQLTSLQNDLRRSLDADPENTGCRVREVALSLQEYEKKAKEYNAQVSACRQAREEAYNALNKHRMAQNIFGGGANDLAALAYYRNESKYNKASWTDISFREDAVLLFRAAQYLKQHKNRMMLPDQNSCSRERTAVIQDQGSKAAEQVTVVAPKQNPGEKKKRSHKGILAAALSMALVSGAVVGLNWENVSGMVLTRIHGAEVEHTTEQTAEQTAEHTVVDTLAQTVVQAATETAGLESPEEDEAGVLLTASTDVRLREGAGTQWAELTVIREGETCRDLGEVSEDGAWRRVSYNGTEGWVFQEYLVPCDTGTIPETISAAEAAEHGQLTGSSAVCLNGTVTVSFDSCSEEHATVTLRIDNRSSQEVSTFGLPFVIVNGRSIELDPFANMGKNLVSVAAGAYTTVTYKVDASLFAEGGEISGEMHTMDPYAMTDNSFRISLTKSAY